MPLLVGVGGFTVIVTESLTVNSPSVAVSASSYAPGAENVAVVAGAFGFPNATVPGPLTLLHTVVKAPSSVATPASVAAAGDVMV